MVQVLSLDFAESPEGSRSGSALVGGERMYLNGVQIINSGRYTRCGLNNQARQNSSPKTITLAVEGLVDCLADHTLKTSSKQVDPPQQ